MSKYKEIFKLKKMLEDAGIEFEFYDRSIKDEEIEQMELPGESIFDAMMLNRFLANRELYQIIIYKSEEEIKELGEPMDNPVYIKAIRLISVVEGWVSHGHERDLLEIMGLTQNGNEVEGYLTAEEVYTRIITALNKNA